MRQRYPILFSKKSRKLTSFSAERYLRNPHARYQPRFDDPFFQQAFKDLVGAMAAEFNGNLNIEFIDSFMYGFWGEGHTWPSRNNDSPERGGYCAKLSETRST